MPFAATDRPNLAVGLLQAGLRRVGIEADSKYFNLTFQRFLSPEEYRRLAVTNMTPLAGEWVFSQVFFGDRFSDWESFEKEVLADPIWGMTQEDREIVRRARAVAPQFLRLVFESNDWSRYDLVGFTSTFQQTMASLSLARMIRESYPEVKIALGGANFEDQMGRPYLEHFDFVDFVSTGEADLSFPALCRGLADVKAGRTDSLEVPPGFLHREGNEIRGTASNGGAFVDLDHLPTPDFEDFFRIAAEKPSWLTVEASRGCWWGQKAHCTFCGLNGAGMTFRGKSWQRVVEEVDELTERYGTYPLQFADNILSMGYFRDLLPHWAEAGHETPKFFEIKANLRRGQVRQMRASGVTNVQPGIESLADSTLQVMQKGVTGAQNIALLRWCVEEGVHPHWNVIYGFPHEDPEDYRRNEELLPKLTHLPSPEGVGPIRLDRFSPNFDRWREHGFTRVAPLPAYRHVFPFPEETLWQLAYYFDYDHPRRAEAMEVGERLVDLGRDWKEKEKTEENGELAMLPHWQGGFVVKDSRYLFEPTTLRLTDEQAALLVACDAPTSREKAVQRTAAALGNGGAPKRPALERALADLIARGWVAEVGPRVVTLALLPQEDRLAESMAWGQKGTAQPIRRAP
jgi:ribosomal peptide maturation radical SAM protein 1